MRNFYRKIAIVVCVLLPVALIFVIREKLSWRPVKIAVLAKNAAFALSPDGVMLVTATYKDHSVMSLRDLQSGKEQYRHLFKHQISELTFSDDGKRLAWAWIVTTEHEMANSTHRTGVSLWDLKGKPRDFEMDKKDLVFDSPMQLRFSPDEKTLWMASSDNLRAWDIGSGKLKWQWRKDDMGRGSSFGFSSAISKDCQLYFRSDSDGYSVWDVKTMKRLLRTKLPFFYDENPEFSADANLATYYGDGFTISKGIFYPIIDARTARVLWRSWGQSPITIVGDKAIRQQANNLEVLNARNGKLFYTLPAVPKSYVLPVASRDWLYSIDHKYETLYRQRLQ